MATMETAQTLYVKAANGIKFAYRRLGQSPGIPLIMEIHLRANMDFWDPLLVNKIAASRPVIMYDRAGVGRTGGEVRTNYHDWANDCIAFVEALGLKQIDIFGFSVGGCSAQMTALKAPELVRKLILAGSTASEPASQVPGIVWPRETSSTKPIQMLQMATSGEAMEASIVYSFFLDTDQGREAARAYISRIYKRTWETAGGEGPIHSLLNMEDTKRQRLAHMEWTTHNPNNSFDRLGELKMPVLIINGNDDVLMATSRSYELLKFIENAQLILYPRSGHGFLWQYAERVAADINTFLDNDL